MIIMHVPMKTQNDHDLRTYNYYVDCVHIIYNIMRDCMYNVYYGLPGYFSFEGIKTLNYLFSWLCFVQLTLTSI